MSNGDYTRMGEVILPGQRSVYDRDEGMPTFGNLPLPPIPLGSTYLGRARWKAVQKLLEAYAGAIGAAQVATRELNLLDMERFERQRVKAMLKDAHKIHEFEAALREVHFLKAQDDLAEARLQQEMKGWDRERRRAAALAEHQAWQRGETRTPGAAPSPGRDGQAQRERQAEDRFDVEQYIRNFTKGRSEDGLPPELREFLAGLRSVFS